MSKPTLAILVNLVAPTRIRLYEHLATAFDVHILHGAMEHNRRSWESPRVQGAEVRRVRGWQFQWTERINGRPFDSRFLHIELAYISELLRLRPDAVISLEMGFRSLVAAAYGAVFGKPVWIWWGGTLHTECYAGWVKKALRRCFAGWVKQWISYGQTSTEYLLSLGIARERILQVQNCVDERLYAFHSVPALDIEPKPVLLHVGQMIARKGVAELLNSAAQLQQEGLIFSLVLVGDGPDRNDLESMASRLALKNVHFYPAQHAHALSSFYNSCDALVFPTLRDVWGLVANEAILCGLPVLCSCYAGCAQELFDSESIFDPADHTQFVNGLRKAITGKLPGGDVSRLTTSIEVGDAIVSAVMKTLGRSASQTAAAQTDEKTKVAALHGS